MVEISDSSFSSYIEEDSSNDSQDESFFYEAFVENDVLVDFGDDYREMNEIVEIEDGGDGGVIAGGEVQMLGESKISAISADVWKFFTRKEKTTRDEQLNHIFFVMLGNVIFQIIILQLLLNVI